MPAVRREQAIRREQPTARCIPYSALIAEGVLRRESGGYLQVFSLGGASFESADDAELNSWHERLNVLWRNIASPNVALWTHTVRRRVQISAKSFEDTPRSTTVSSEEVTVSEGFAAALTWKYERRLSGETLMVNELYLSIVFRPAAG